MKINRTQYKTLVIAAVALMALALAPTNGYATALTIPDGGVLQIANLSGTLVGVTTVSTPCINWGDTSTTTTACNTTPVNMGVSGVSTIFAAPSTGTIGDIAGTSYTAETTPFETVTGAGAEVGNTINFNLSSVVVNTGATVGNCASNAANNSCTPALSPFTFQMNSTGTQLTISFTALLTAYTGTVGSGSTPYQAIFATQESGTVSGSGACNGVNANITSVLNCEAMGGTVTATWSAAESPATVTPEPITTLLIGTGLVGVALLSRRRRRKS